MLLTKSESIEINCEGSFQLCDISGDKIVMFQKSPSNIALHFENGVINAGGKAKFESGIELYTHKKSFSVNGRNYRGRLKIIPYPESERIAAINEIPLELYLAGVISSEVPARWPDETLKAQSVASRSYALFQANQREDENWHLRTTQANQVYRGIEAEEKKIWRILLKTQGEVLLVQNSEDILPAYFSSTCGGATFKASEVFGGEDFSIVGVECPYCKKSAKKDYLNWPEFEISLSELRKKLVSNYSSMKKLGKIKDIRPAETLKNAGFEKITKVRIICENGDETLRAEDLRLTADPTGIKFRSTVCRLEIRNGTLKAADGKGFGHNVGMCQYGAKQMAVEGNNYRQILKHYYPEAVLERIY
ncbi:SpoIID/LytB domain-containing protein [Sedimentisphaera cyanobacteriorum]|uniref:SpoIID/LytB domain-containing protein n=1 Tax=Sedimentisphaera cyanobacteriorum TaxID=1940790 RepID=UPI0013731BD6|nr:SpoIID/LytB domain-containing protein [Sedimentisphaera cyanobacteriorum]